MKSILIISLLVTYLTLSQGRFLYDSLNPLTEFDREEQLDQLCRVSWHVNTDTKTVIFEVVAQTPGWVGFGISKFGAMPDSDLIMGGVDGGTNYFTDRHTDARSEPLVDAVQNWELISASEDSNVTTLKFQRAFDTGDATDDIPIEDADVSFIWALGATDDTTKQHVNRGSFPVNILSSGVSETSPPPPSTSTTDSSSGSDFVRSYRFNENFTATWQVYADLKRVIFEVEANTSGWVAFGISESGTMTNADVIMGGIHDDKTPYFSDRFSAGHGEPKVDAEQNWEFLEGRESENRTYLRFVRDFETTDNVEDINISDKRTYFVWAIGSSDNTSVKHTSRGSYRLNILQAETPLNFVRTEVLSENLTASWDVDYVSDSVIFEVWAKTTGYIGFGLSESGTMSGADLIIGGVNDDLSPYFEDRFSQKHGVPAIDTEQNWILLAAREDANETYLRFIRNFDTGDVDNDFQILDRDTYFIWAIGTTDNIARHAYRGSFLVNILEPSKPPTTTTTEAPPIPDNFIRQVQLNENLTVEWTADFQNKIITFETIALTTGYIGFGIADSGSMTNADLIIGGVDENGVAYFNDRFATRHGVPNIDTYQNWFLISASESNTTTRLRFTRGFDTGDTIGDYPIEDRQTNFIWAIGSSDNLQRHATRGAYPVNILEPPASVPGTTSTSTERSACDDVYRREEELSTTTPFAVSWEVDSIKSYITFEVTAETTGFVGFGFSDSGTMENADLVYGGVKDGNGYLHDMFASKNGAPTEDTENNWDLISGREDTRTTTLKFGRNIVTSDTVQDRPIENKETYFIWAIGATDDIAYHSNNRGTFRVNILECENGNGPTGTTTITTTEAPPIPDNFVRRVQINENLTVEWAADFQNKIITFETIMLTTGYTGFGISDTGTMANADLIIGGVGENGVAYFNDRFATRHGVPNIDTYQNWFLISASESNTTTRLRFTRGFDTGDVIGDYPIEDRQTYFIWAIGSSDDIQKHAIRGAYQVNILEPPVSVPGPSTEPSACDGVYRREEELSTTTPFAVSWEVNAIKRYITFEVTAETTGFVGFGFSDSGTMENADLVYGGVKDGNGYLNDMFASKNGAPTEDTESNWDLISGREDTRTTTLKFGRNIVTSDNVQDRPIEDKETYFIWAIGATDDLDYHSTNRDNFRVNILECENGNGPSGSPTISTTPSSGGKNVISVTLLTLTLFLFLY